jgi:hypothetical protein
MATLHRSTRPGVTRRCGSAFALWLSLCAPGFAAEANAVPRFELRAGAVRALPPATSSRFALSARLQPAKPAVDANARFKASARLKATTAACGAAGSSIFGNGFEGS